MPNLQVLFKKYSIKPIGIIHIGAHEGHEVKTYLEMGVKNILFIEANPDVFKKLENNIKNVPIARAVNYAISDVDGIVDFHITSMDQSSSILPLKFHKLVYPEIVEVKKISVQSRKLDTLLTELNLFPGTYNIFIIDIQGAELLAFQGSKNTLKYIDAIITEVNFAELYEGCVIIDQLDIFLDSCGFKRVSTTTPYHPSWGDALYVRKPKIIMSTLGLNGRFANQFFQYAFLKIYAKEHNLQVETPQWIGRYLFGHNDSLISGKLPVVIEDDKTTVPSEKFVIKTENPLFNVDIWGFFQYNAKYYDKYKQYFRSLFKPVSDIKKKLDKAVNKLYSKGKTIVGLHLRRGDYGYSCFFITPNEWYLSWLEEIWDTLDDPVLFIASDEPHKVIGSFSKYNPVTIKDLEIEFFSLNYYSDFYILSNCDLVAISNSSFSFASCMLNEKAKTFMRPVLPLKKLVPFDPWDSDILLR